jgi:hypothetical protein
MGGHRASWQGEEEVCDGLAREARLPVISRSVLILIGGLIVVAPGEGERRRAALMVTHGAMGRERSSSRRCMVAHLNASGERHDRVVWPWTSSAATLRAQLSRLSPGSHRIRHRCPGASRRLAGSPRRARTSRRWKPSCHRCHTRLCWGAAARAVSTRWQRPGWAWCLPRHRTRDAVPVASGALSSPTPDALSAG